MRETQRACYVDPSIGGERIGGPAWFRLGDEDIATHLARTANVTLLAQDEERLLGTLTVRPGSGERLLAAGTPVGGRTELRIASGREAQHATAEERHEAVTAHWNRATDEVSSWPG